jgi:hypothetical protein
VQSGHDLQNLHSRHGKRGGAVAVIV